MNLDSKNKVGRQRLSQESAAQKAAHAAALRTGKFIGFVGGMYQGSRTKVILSCSAHGEWSTTEYNNLVNKGCWCRRCGMDSKDRRQSENKMFPEHSAKANAVILAIARGGEFLNFVGRYKGAHSKVKLRCNIHGVWTTTSYSAFCNGGWCPRCAVDKKRALESEVLKKINSICQEHRLRFIAFERGEYVNKNSEIRLACADEKHATWPSTVRALFRGNTGCQMCSKYGFDQSKRGHLYALISEDGCNIKIGISNYPDRRVKELRRRTPFRFVLLAKIGFEVGASAREAERYFHNKYAKAELIGFDGATEWLRYCPELMQEIRETT